MDIFIAQLSERTNIDDVRQFFRPYCRITTFRMRTGQVSFYGFAVSWARGRGGGSKVEDSILVCQHTDEVNSGLRAIRELNGRWLAGKKVLLSESRSVWRSK